MIDLIAMYYMISIVAVVGLIGVSEYASLHWRPDTRHHKHDQ